MVTLAASELAHDVQNSTIRLMQITWIEHLVPVPKKKTGSPKIIKGRSLIKTADCLFVEKDALRETEKQSVEAVT